jgi:hypothetical protein
MTPTENWRAPKLVQMEEMRRVDGLALVGFKEKGQIA